MEHGYVLAILGTGRRSLRPLRRNLPDTRRAHWPGLADRTVHHFHSAGIVVGYAESYALGLGTAVRTLNTEVTEDGEGLLYCRGYRLGNSRFGPFTTRECLLLDE